ncbi:DedA family protein [Acuticoccus mangrovi]|uniref:DedA family protein n=1 Tax=Acuticoccus mangrovi TaxID=2796142 RepID=A0A934MJH4_9HYPH|nr:DedA family protein [Acuticoccus mangrovi]MBJ3774554.1 DedA family protein [Acuticoccus mangrovi]
MFDWITALVERTGYLGIAILMLVENVFPPIPSEVIMPVAGYSAGSGGLNLVAVIVAGSAGSVGGAYFWYLVGKRLGLARVERATARWGRWLTIEPQDIHRASAWFARNQERAVLIGRLVPTIRTLISIPAGIAHMGTPRFLAFTTVGSVLFCAALAVAGYALGSQHKLVSEWMNVGTNLFLAAIIALYLYRVVTFRRGGRRISSGRGELQGK